MKVSCRYCAKYIAIFLEFIWHKFVPSCLLIGGAGTFKPLRNIPKVTSSFEICLKLFFNFFLQVIALMVVYCPVYNIMNTLPCRTFFFRTISFLMSSGMYWMFLLIVYGWDNILVILFTELISLNNLFQWLFTWSFNLPFKS